MLIDYLTERHIFSQSNIAVSVILYALAGAAALILRRWGQVRCKKKSGTCQSGLWRTILRDLPSEIWGITFFLLTGCLKGTIRKEERTEDKTLNRKVFFGGIYHICFGAAGGFVLYTLFQLLQSALGGSFWEIFFLGARALTAANLSLLWFSILPLPGSDAETFLRTKTLGAKEKSFRENETLPFFLFCMVGLLLACIPVPMPNGTIFSLSSLLTLFPLILIGG